MKKIEGRLKRSLKRKIKVTEALVVLFLITGGIGYGETAKESIVVKKEVGITKEIGIEKERNFKTSDGKDKIRVRIRMQEENLDKENFIFSEIIKHTDEKGPRDLETILEQIYYKSSNLTVEQWSKKENVEIIVFVEEKNKWGLLFPLGALLLGATAVTKNGGSDSAYPPPPPPVLPYIWENGVSVGDDITDHKVESLDVRVSGVAGVRAIGSHIINKKTRVSVLGDINVGESVVDLSLIQTGTEKIGAQALNGAEITNKGTMNVGLGSIGMQALVTNDSKWLDTIGLYGDTTDLTSVINEGTIFGDDAKVGMLSNEKNTEARNSGTIDGTFLVAAMVAADGGMATNTAEGIIINDGKSGMTALGAGAIAKNQGTIINPGTTANTVSYGMYAKAGGKVVNEGGITYSGSNKLFEAMYVTGDSSLGFNTGEILNTGDFTATADSEGAKIINEGTITFRKVGLAAINGATVVNEKDAIIISDNVNMWWATAIRSDGVGSLAINYGTVMSPGIVMEAMDGGMAINYADISGNIMQVLAASGTTDVPGNPVGTMINFGKLTTNGDVGILVEGGIGINNGTIALTGNEGMYVNVSGTAVNGANGIIENTGVGGISLSTKLNGLGVYEIARGENHGIIRNKSDFGMVAAGRNAIGINFKTIANTGDYGMHAEAGGVVLNQLGGVVENSGQKKMSAAAYPIYDWTQSAPYPAHAINQGTINVNGDGGIGMYADKSGIALNDVTGEIYLNGTNGIGMMANGAGAQIYNKGKIYLDLTGSGYGTIVEDNNSTFVDSAGNTAFKLDNGGEFHNDGIITVLGAFDTGRSIAGDGTGKFVVEGGKVEANSIGGNFYASGALAMGNYNDVQNTYELFKTENMYANILSNSAMYNASLTKDKTLDGYYGIEMTRKNFNEVIEDSNFAAYLENNYKEQGSTAERNKLYDALKLLTTTAQINNASNQLSGNSIFPALEYQTLSNIRGINNAIQSEVYSTPTNEDVRYIGFAKYKDSEVKMGGSVEDYTAKLSTVTLGMDKALSNNIRIGFLGTAGKSDYDFDNRDTRKEEVYQSNLIGSYEKNGFVGTASIFYGITNGDTKRNVVFGTINSETKGDLETEYYGMNLGIQKKIENGMFNITPRVELNMTKMSQDNLNENATNGYAISIDSVDSTSVESGIGFTVDKVILVANGIIITPSASLIYYREFGNPYKDTDAKLYSTGSTDSFKINGYDVEKNRGELSVAIKVKKNFLEGSLGAEFKVDDQGNSVTPFISIGCKF